MSDSDTSIIEPPLAAIAALMAHPPFVPLTSTYPLPAAFRSALAHQLNTWREAHHTATRGRRSLLSAKVFMPDRQLNALADYGGAFLRAAEITPVLILRVTPWDLAGEDELREVAQVIGRWCAEVSPQIGLSQGKKKARRKKKNTKPISQPAGAASDSTPAPSDVQGNVSADP